MKHVFYHILFSLSMALFVLYILFGVIAGKLTYNALRRKQAGKLLKSAKEQRSSVLFTGQSALYFFQK